MSDIEIGSVWVSKKNVSAILVVSDVGGLRVETYWLGDPKNKFEWFKDDFLSKYDLQQDMVNHPPHYKDASGIECIEVTKYMSFLGGNCFKYLYRAGKKGSAVEDLKKAIWYAERAWIGNEQVCDEAVEGIGSVAEYRTGHVQSAMLELVTANWLGVIDAVDRELDMLGDCDD